eukprot:257408_1
MDALSRSDAKLEEKLFFEGKYEECLEVIRNTIPQLSDYDERKENLAILGSQCLFETGKGTEIKSFFEISYHRQALLLPPTIFFVYINYLFHDNQYKLAISSLKEFKERGKPMSKDEYVQWVKLIIYDGFINHRKYKRAIKFLKRQHRLKHPIKNDMMNQIKVRMKQDASLHVSELNHTDSDSDSSVETLSDYNGVLYEENELSDDDEHKVNERELAMIQKETENKPKTALERLIQKVYYVMTVIQQNTDRKMVFQMVCIVIIVWILTKIAKRNKKQVKEYISDFRNLLIMSIGKSRISV